MTSRLDPQRSRHPSTRRGGGGPSKFDFRNNAAWTPKGADTPPRGGEGGALKIRFSKSCRLDPPKEQTPLHEERGGEGSPQNSIFEIMPLGPPKGADTPPRGEGRGGIPQNSLARNMHLQVDKQQPNTTEIAPDGQGQRQVRQRPLQTSTGRAKHDTCRSKRTGQAKNTTPADPNVILSTLWDVKRSTPQRKKPHALWYYLFRLRREGTASPGGAAPRQPPRLNPRRGDGL